MVFLPRVEGKLGTKKKEDRGWSEKKGDEDYVIPIFQDDRIVPNNQIESRKFLPQRPTMILFASKTDDLGFCDCAWFYTIKDENVTYHIRVEDIYCILEVIGQSHIWIHHNIWKPKFSHIITYEFTLWG